jgi:hypothetical protein
MAKAEIGWTRKTEDGTKIDFYARRIGDRWHFFSRQQRYEPWKSMAHPRLIDWTTLLNAVERRLARRLVRPEDVDRLKKTIREKFPEAELQ